MELIQEAKVATRCDTPYIGIKFSAPYRKMFHFVDLNFKQLHDWLKTNKIIPEGPFFLRYNLIDMAGEMELEVGVMGSYTIPADQHVYQGTLPGGLYASLVYKGLGLAATKYLLTWIQDNNHTINKASHTNGDEFSCRYEAYLTDRKIEPRKKKWDIELSIQLIC